MTTPLSYTPYQSHRRAASSASLGGSSGSAQQNGAFVATQGQSSSKVARQDHAELKNGVTSSRSTMIRPIAQQVHTTGAQPNGQRGGEIGKPSAPPPLRSASSLRAAQPAAPPLRTLASSTSSEKGKANADQSKGKKAEAAASSNVTSPTRKSVSSSLEVPSSGSTSQAGTSSTQKEAYSTGNQGNRSSLTPSPAPGHGHSRSLSSNSALPASLPHIMSTAQRLRTASPMGNTSPTSSSPSQTPTVSSPALDSPFGGASLPNDIHLSSGSNGHPYGEGIGRATAYRHGFQPKGTYRVRTDEFAAARRKRKDGSARGSQNGEKGTQTERSELDSERLERRLEKMMAIHYDENLILTEEEALGMAPSWLPGSIRRARLQAEADRRVREEEMRIVKWEDDKTRKACPICTTPFSLTVRKHHCRLCGRVVCASPHLSMPPGLPASPGRVSEKKGADAGVQEVKCSSMMISDGKGGSKIKEVPRWDDAVIGGSGVDAEGRTRGIRICRDCKDTIMHRQYMLDDGNIPAYLKLYEALQGLKKEIEQSLPEFQEMVLGLQKHDAAAALGTSNTEETTRDPLSAPLPDDVQTLTALKAKNRTTLALQRDAAQARKQLLANFANYDLVAKKIRNLDDEGNASLARMKVAIYTQANVFLQTNMFPLQNLPKLTSAKDNPGRSSGQSTPKRSTAPLTAQERKTMNSNGDQQQNAEEIRESLEVLQQQLTLVRQYAASASRSRKLQDASSLQASARELEAEIARLRQSLVQR